MATKLIVSNSPHIHDSNSTQRLMNHVVIALLPAFAISVYFFGIGSLIVAALAVSSAVFFEWVITKYVLKEQPTLYDMSAVVAGLLFAFCLPANLHPGLVVLGSLVTIGVGKMTFGGLGKNPFNPALVGRVFLFVSFPVQMTNWPLPMQDRLSYIDSVTGATVLGRLKEGLDMGKTLPQLIENMPNHKELFMGYMGGSLGEIAAGALIIGFFWLLFQKVITWHIPVFTIGTIFAFQGILYLADSTIHAGPVFHVLSGGILLGSIYMATDYVTSPMTNRGKVIYAIGIGLLTVIIRVWGAYPEGIQFAILILNAFVPLINRYIKPRRFGKVKPVKVQ